MNYARAYNGQYCNAMPDKRAQNGRDDRIRTCDVLLPKQARYQTAPHPDASGRRDYTST